jgi:hypothetical protein
MSDTDALIEKFAMMIENGFTLNSDDVSSHAMELIEMLSHSPNLGETLSSIHQELQILLDNTSIEATPQSVATQIRALKESYKKLHVLH